MAQVKVMHNIQMQNNNFPSTVTKQAGISTSDLELTSECDSHVRPKEVCACWRNYVKYMASVQIEQVFTLENVHQFLSPQPKFNNLSYTLRVLFQWVLCGGCGGSNTILCTG